MRRRVPFWVKIAAGGAGIALTVAGCSGTRAGGGEENSETGDQGAQISIVMVTHGQASDPFWNVVKHGGDAAARDFNVKLSYQAPAKGDPVEMAQLIRGAIAQKPAGIAVSIPDASALREPIGAAVEAGIPVVSLNSGGDVANQLGVLAHVGQEEKPAGQGGGERMAQAGVKNALCVIHEQGNTALDLRCAGFEQSMKAAGAKVTRLAVNGSDPTDAQRKIEGALARDSGIDGIFTLGPLGFTPAGKAIAGKSIKLATFDLSPEVLQAVQGNTALFAIDQQQWLQGYLPVQFLAQNNRYGLHPTNVVLTGPNFVTPENAAQVIDLTKKGIR